MEVDILDLSARGISSLHTFWSSEQFLLRWMESMVQILWLTGHGIVVWYALQFLPNILSSKAVIFLFFWSTNPSSRILKKLQNPQISNGKWSSSGWKNLEENGHDEADGKLDLNLVGSLGHEYRLCFSVNDQKSLIRGVDHILPMGLLGEQKRVKLALTCFCWQSEN